MILTLILTMSFCLFTDPKGVKNEYDLVGLVFRDILEALFCK